MVLRSTYQPETHIWSVESWRADSNEPEILYSGESVDGPEVFVELSPDQMQVLVQIYVHDMNDIRIQRFFTFYTDYNVKSDSTVIDSPVVAAFFMDAEVLGGEEWEDRSFDERVFRPLPIRQADLLAAFRTQVAAMPFTETLQVLNPQQEKLRRVYDHIQSSDDLLLPVIQEFIKGRALQSRVRYTMNKAVEKLIRNTLQGDLGMFQLSAQDLWNAGVHRA